MWNTCGMAILAIILLPNSYMAASRNARLQLRHGETTIRFVQNMPDGKHFVSASFDGTVVMWDVRSGKVVWHVDFDEGSKTKNSYTISHIEGMDISSDASTIAISYSQARVVGDSLQKGVQSDIAFLNAEDGRVRKTLTTDVSHIGKIAFSPDGCLLLSESGDNAARLWSVNTGKQVLLIKLKERGASVAFSPDGKVFAVATQPVWGLPPQHIVGLYDASKGQLLREFPSKNAVTSLAFSPDSQALAIASGDAIGAQIDIWQLTAQDPRLTLQMPRRKIKVVRFTKDGRSVALGGYGNGKGLVQLRTISTNKPTRNFTFKEEVTALDLSPDGRQLVVGTDKGQIALLPLQNLRS